MLWFTLSLLTALAASSQDAWIKKYFSQLTPYEMGMYPLLFSLPLFLGAMPFIPVPPLDSAFWQALLGTLVLNSVAYFLYMAAIKASPLSLTIPFLSFTPAFMIFTGYFVLNEAPSRQGVLGILVTLAGGYVLNLNPGQRSALSPVKAVMNEKGSRLMLLVALIYSLSAVLDKKAILHSSPPFFAIFFYVIFSPILVLYFAVSGRVPLRSYKTLPVPGLIAGVLLLHTVFHVWAISLTTAAYMISIKRLSVLFSILYGKMLFGEPHIRIRLVGGVIMLSGAILIALSG